VKYQGRTSWTRWNAWMTESAKGSLKWRSWVAEGRGGEEEKRGLKGGWDTEEKVSGRPPPQTTLSRGHQGRNGEKPVRRAPNGAGRF